MPNMPELELPNNFAFYGIRVSKTSAKGTPNIVNQSLVLVLSIERTD